MAIPDSTLPVWGGTVRGMADFSTPLPIHKAAFPRIGGQLAMPAPAIEELRKLFQAAERRGVPFQEIAAAVGSVVGEEDWRWPWFEATRAMVVGTFTLPLDWQQEGIPLTAEWDRIPHAKKVRLLTSTMCAALYVERELASWRSLKGSQARLELKINDKRCATSRVLQLEHAAAIAAGDVRNLPPFFPGDQCYLAVDVRRR